ncbi:hypothetical protein EXIGLDRAFT_704211 [Exidia glandulosa HHB12029]|uniref:Peptidase S8/S53 domain-containing protein n=1 Tax=Exidia glandulosa HHB12029 TaxID=1314781 RepID=A0A165BRZ6_EXIGL|nr:hypothetical protein EXIGLDRAFT_704211 [Exidia glandulosa HHB12029]
MPVARLVALSLAFLGIPALLSITPPNGQTRPNGFVVLLKPEFVSRQVHHNILAPFLLAANDTTTTTGGVLPIEHDTLGGLDATVTQEEVPWGLQRNSQAARMNRSDDRAANFRYTYDNAARRGVVSISFSRIFEGYQDRDGFGHGTDVAGTAAVRVMDDKGSGCLLVDVIAPDQHIASDYIGGYMSPEDMVKQMKEVTADGIVRGLPTGRSNELVINVLRR